MCNIWQNPSRDEIAPEHYRKLPRSLRAINITGGEPFLRKDVVEVIRAIDSVLPSARLVFSTNGSMTDTIVSKMKEIRNFHKKVGVGVSIDGLEEMHDKVRGVPGFFRRGISTIERLKEAGFEDLRIAMTLVGLNSAQVREVFNLAENLGVEFTLTAAHDSEIYFQKTGNVSNDIISSAVPELAEVISCQLRSSSPKEWIRAYHTMGIADPIHRSRYVSECEAGRRYFFMSPTGDVYPCNVMDLRIGNLADVDRWEDLFTKELDARIRREVSKCEKNCWMICNTKSLILAHPFRVGAWVAKGKASAHLKRER